MNLILCSIVGFVQGYIGVPTLLTTMIASEWIVTVPSAEDEAHPFRKVFTAIMVGGFFAILHAVVGLVVLSTIGNHLPMGAATAGKAWAAGFVVGILIYAFLPTKAGRST